MIYWKVMIRLSCENLVGKVILGGYPYVGLDRAAVAIFEN